MERAFQYLLALLCLVSLAAADLCSHGQRFSFSLSFLLRIVERIAPLIYAILESRSTNPPRMDAAQRIFERGAIATVIFNLQVPTLLTRESLQRVAWRRLLFIRDSSTLVNKLME